MASLIMTSQLHYQEFGTANGMGYKMSLVNVGGSSIEMGVAASQTPRNYEG
jgi:hypothetical protein